MRVPRRTALKLMSVGAVTMFAGNVSYGQQGLRTRRSLTNMPLDDPDISTYRDFVGLMKSKDQNTAVSWLGFSLQHGAFNGPFKYCPHGDWYFLPWHRTYVMMYETAAQELVGNKDFAMPYWNWTEVRMMPEAFANPVYKGKPNPLYVPNRNPLTGANALTDDIVGKEVMDSIYAETAYEAFGTSRDADQTNLDLSWVVAGGGIQGTLESTPHNTVHINIGAFMPTAGSPRDPIFFMHHCNIDRIWASWNALGRQNSTDPLWLNMPFTDNYLRPDGTLYTTTVKDLQSTAELGYTYDYLPQPDGRTPDPAREARVLALLHSVPGAALPGVQRIGGGPELTATALKPLQQKWSMNEATLKAVAAPAPGTRGSQVYALIQDIMMGDNVQGIRVFVDRPDVTTDVPNADPHYVTSFTFLDHRAGHATAGGHNVAAASNKHLPSVMVNLTDTLRRLYGFRRLKPGALTIQLIPIPASGVVLENVGKVVPGSVEIVVL